MKKIIAFLLCFTFSFGSLSAIRQKQSQAIAIVAGYSIAQILGALALSSTVVAGGYVIGDTLVNPEDNSEFTDFLQQVFNQTLEMSKHEVPPPPEPLGTLESATLLSMLMNQGIEVGKDLYTMVYNYFIDNQPMQTHEDYSFLNDNDKWISYKYKDSPKTYVIKDINTDTVFFNDRGMLSANKQLEWYIEQNDGSFSPVLVSIGTRFLEFGLDSILGGNIDIYTNSSATTLSEYTLGGSIGGPVLPTTPDIITDPDSMPTPEEYTPVFKNVDLTPLNGLVKNPAELIDIINGVKKVPDYVYGKITGAFNDIYEGFQRNPNFSGAGAPISPSIDPVKGTQYYGDPLLEEPVIESPEAPDTELSFWGKVLYWLKAIWQTLRDIALSILQIPGKIILPNADPWLQPLLDGLRDLFVPSADFITDKIDTFQDNFSFIETFRESVNWFETFRTSDGYPFVRVDLSKYHGTFNGQSVSMGEYAYILDLRFYAPYKFIGDLMITAFIYIMFIWKFFGRLPEIINGAGMISTTNAKIEQFEAKERKKK